VARRYGYRHRAAALQYTSFPWTKNTGYWRPLSPS
jgi:hypothetical protein